MTAKIKLTGGPEKTATWIWLQDHQLKVEFYDFSETAQRMFGNDIAYTITVWEMDRLRSLTDPGEASLPHWMAERFQTYFGIRRWLEENHIGFSLKIESWA